MKTFKQLLTENHGDTFLATELFFKCRQSALYTHFCHLTTKSFAEHSAFGAFYEGIIPLLDKFMEAFIGRYGKLEHVQDSLQVPFKVTIQDLISWIETNRYKLTDSTELQNILDELLGLCNSTIYKLDNLH